MRFLSFRFYAIYLSFGGEEKKMKRKAKKKRKIKEKLKKKTEK